MIYSLVSHAQSDWLHVLPGWWCEFIFCAAGRFVHTLSDQTLNTNSYDTWLFIYRVVVVVVVVVYSLLLFMFITLYKNKIK